MPNILAVLSVATTQTVNSVTVAMITPEPVPISLIGLPTQAIYGIVTDLENSRMQFSYLVYQTYNSTGGATGMAQASGTSAWVSIPGVSRDFPNVSVSTTTTSTISGTNVEFTLSVAVSYTETTPTLKTVVTV